MRRLAKPSSIKSRRENDVKEPVTLPELGQSIQRFAYLAYPSAFVEIRETLAKNQFVDELADSEMRIRIKQSRLGHLKNAI